MDRWEAPQGDGARVGTITVTIDGAPIKFTGSLHLEPTATGARATIAGDLKAGIPFLGGKIEQAAAPGHHRRRPRRAAHRHRLADLT